MVIDIVSGKSLLELFRLITWLPSLETVRIEGYPDYEEVADDELAKSDSGKLQTSNGQHRAGQGPGGCDVVLAGVLSHRLNAKVDVRDEPSSEIDAPSLKSLGMITAMGS